MVLGKAKSMLLYQIAKDTGLIEEVRREEREKGFEKGFEKGLKQGLERGRLEGDYLSLSITVKFQDNDMKFDFNGNIIGARLECVARRVS